MAFDSPGKTATIDKTGAEATKGSHQGDHLQQYRVTQADVISKPSGTKEAGAKFIDFSESPTTSTRPALDFSGAPGTPNSTKPALDFSGASGTPNSTKPALDFSAAPGTPNSTKPALDFSAAPGTPNSTKPALDFSSAPDAATSTKPALNFTGDSGTPAAHGKKSADGSNHGSEPNMDEIRKKVRAMFNGDSGTTPKAEAPAKGDSAAESFAGFNSQPVYGADKSAIKQTVDKYGSKLDDHSKQNLSDMISATALGQTDNLNAALAKSTPESRSAYADTLRHEAGRNVDLNNKPNGGFDLSVYDKTGASKVEMSRGNQFAPTSISSGWENGKALPDANPWNMSTDRKAVNQAMNKLSDSAGKYRTEVGQTR